MSQNRKLLACLAAPVPSVSKPKTACLICTLRHHHPETKRLHQSLLWYLSQQHLNRTPKRGSPWRLSLLPAQCVATSDSQQDFNSTRTSACRSVRRQGATCKCPATPQVRETRTKSGAHCPTHQVCLRSCCGNAPQHVSQGMVAAVGCALGQIIDP